MIKKTMIDAKKKGKHKKESKMKSDAEKRREKKKLMLSILVRLLSDKEQQKI